MTIPAPSSAVATADSDWRRNRRSLDQSLSEDLIVTIEADHRTMLLGRDPQIEALAIGHGLGQSGLAIARIRLRNWRMTVVCVPDAIWSGAFRHRLRELKLGAVAVGRRCVLVPASFTQRQPRLENSRAILRDRCVPVSTTARMAIVGHLLAEGRSTVLDCANLINQHPDPCGAIFSLVATRLIRLDLDQTITPHSIIELVQNSDMACSRQHQRNFAIRR